ncbi:MAG: hypothetical protein ACE367_10000 [Acidimicrobiales bacterium]
MSVFAFIVLILAAALGVAALGWFLFQRNHPEDFTTHEVPGDQPEPTESDEYYELADRPAGPDAEPMDPERLGGDHRPPS